MRIVSLRLKEFRRYRDLALEFPDGVAALVGANGSGKSTLLEAVLFGLFGTRALRTVKDQVRHAQAAPADHVEVQLEFEVASQAVSIRRSLRGRSQAPDASLTIDGAQVVQPGAGSMEAATREVERILGLDLDGFRATVIAQQKDLGRLAEMRPAQRKQQILAMMGIDRLDRAIQDARSRRRSTADRLEGMRSLLGDASALRRRSAEAALALQHADAAIEAAVQEHAAALATAAAAERSLVALRARHEERQRLAQAAAGASAALERSRILLGHAQARHEDARKAYEEAQVLAPRALSAEAAERALASARETQRSAQAHQDATARLAALERRLAVAREGLPATMPHDPAPTLLEHQTKAATLEAQIQAVHARRHRLESLGHDAPCPTCEQPLNGQLVATVGRLAQEAAQLVGSHNEVLEVIQGRTRERQEWVALQQRAADAARLEQQVTELRAAMPPCPDHTPALAPLEAVWKEAREAQLAWRSATDRAKGLDASVHACKEAEAAMAQASAQAQAADEALAAIPLVAGLDAAEAGARQAAMAERAAADRVALCRQQQAVATQASRSASQAAAEDAARRAQVAEAEVELRHWSALSGPRGGLLDDFRDHLTDRIGPALAQEAGRLLARFTGGRYDEVLLDQDYGVFVSDGGTWYSLERFSGGEADVVHLALRLAVGRLLAERSRAEIRFLALDEVFGSLDADRRRHVLAALESLGGLYTQVLVVTHLGELRDALDHTMECVDDGDGARLVMHNG